MTVKITPSQIKRFHKKIFSYYAKNKRELVWRKTTDPYKILLSELMLQQTQVSRVEHYYIEWTQHWPTIHELAKASRSEVLKMWMGLGYNNRAVRLHKAAQVISTTYKGDVLAAMKNYTEIPGVGRYTAHAVQIFADNADMVTVDTNIRRILLHEFSLPEESTDDELWTLAQRCLPKGESREWHNALMDYGAQFLTAKTTGIKPKTHQSKFKGSDRQIRAQILRLLLDKPQTIIALQSSLKIQEDRLYTILSKMKRDGLVTQKSNTYKLVE